MADETPDAPIQLETAEFESEATGTSACAACHRPLQGEYWTVNAISVCGGCAQQLADAQHGGSGLARFSKAGLLGVLGAVAGAGLYFLVVKLTGYEIGLIAIVVGFLVGAGVRRGAEHRGGWLYQLVAVGLTYVAIVSTYVPFIVQGLAEGEDAITGPAAWILASLFALPAPFLAGFENVIGLLIIGFALWQAFRMNARRHLEIAGPHELAPATAPVLPGEPEADAPA